MRALQRLCYERAILKEMIAVYCRGNHHSGKRELCLECTELLDYAIQRLNMCKFGNAKDFCSNCSVHCYRLQQRESIKAVMRYAGPRMLLRRPVMAIRHLLETKKQSRSMRLVAEFSKKRKFRR
jgi:hypothetical protein